MSTITAQAGNHIAIDTWPKGWYRLVDCTDWDAAPLRVVTEHDAVGAYLPTPSGKVELAVRVEVTGRTLRKAWGGVGYRCRVTFVGDGEPDTVVGGWLFA